MRTWVRSWDMLMLKPVLVPILIGLVSAIGRRWGPGVSGLVVGLPWTSGPVLLFLSLERGAPFASEAAVGILEGVVSLVAFCVAYSWAAFSMGWARSSLAGVAAYLAVTVALVGASLPLAASFAFAPIVLVVGLRSLPRGLERTADSPSAAWDIPLRMATATVMVVALTGLAEALGARLAGLLAPFPVYAGVLAVFAHREAGRWGAVETLGGVIRGSFSFADFFLVAGIGLESLGLAGGFLAASVSAVGLHVVLLETFRAAALRTSPGGSS